MRKKISWLPIIGLSLLTIFLDNPSLRAQESLKIEQTIFAKKDGGQIKQQIKISLAGTFPLKFILQAKTETRMIEEFFQFPEPVSEFYFFLPACDKASCPVEIKILDENKIFLADANFDLKPVRTWKIYIVPFTHTDIGFTQSQRKVLIQNLQNLKTELALIEQTREYPEKSRFKLFTEVSWAVDEFLKSQEVTEAEKENLKKAIQDKNIELGAFYISHQNKFMPDEAVFASLIPALRISDQLNVPLQTACLHDVFDFSGFSKSLYGAGVKYLMVGPNDARYLVPPLFYLTPPKGKEKILVWHTVGLNGYGENFNLKMRLMPPLEDSAFAEMESLVNQHLQSLESGYPNSNLSEFYDYYGASWQYPYDAYLLPFYPAVGGDNQPQNIAPSEIAKKWNEKWAWPEMIVSTPSEFFEYVEKNFPDGIPVIKGEMSGFWGEQIFLSMMQVDPQKEKKQREFERNAVDAGIMLADKFLAGETAFNPWDQLWQGYKPLILNNDHNPMPVPFGGLKYTQQDVKEWKQTRTKWIDQMEFIGKQIFAGDSFGSTAGQSPAKESRAFREGEDYILENKFYRLQVDSKNGGIKSIIDKELGKELVNPGSDYMLNQYLLAVRGEVLGLRDYLKVQPGFRRIQIEYNSGALEIKGETKYSINSAEALAKFADNAFGIKIPASALNAVAKIFFFKDKKPIKLKQKIILPDTEKRIEFIQHFSGNMPQWVEQIFAYPLNFPETTPIEYDAGYNLLSFTPGFPLGNGDLIPAAKNLKNFASINASLVPFQWMYGLPPDFTFRNYLMLRGDDYAVAFTSRESGAVIPGALKPDPVKGPFGGGFYHLGLGWTLWGKIGLGADLENEFIIHSALTSFPAQSDSEAREKAARFSWNFNGKIIPRQIQISPASAVLVNAWPENDSVLALRLWETSGRKTDLKIDLNTGRNLKAVYLARSDGKPISSLGFQGNSFSADLGAGQVLTLRLEFAQK